MPDRRVLQQRNHKLAGHVNRAFAQSVPRGPSRPKFDPHRPDPVGSALLSMVQDLETYLRDRGRR